MTMTKEDAKKRMQEIADRLNEASRAYYQTAVEIIPNIEYDALYDELLDLEKEFGILISGWPGTEWSRRPRKTSPGDPSTT